MGGPGFRCGHRRVAAIRQLWKMQAWGEMNQKREGGWGVESRGPRSLTEACLRAVSGPLGRNNLNNAEIAAFSRHPSPQVWWGQTDRTQQPRVRCQPLPPLSKGAHMRVTLSLFTLPLHFPCSQFCGLYLAGGLQISSLLLFFFYHHLSPPRSLQLCPRRCLWGGRQDVQPTRRSKSPLRVNVPSLAVTFSTPIELTSQMHARLGLQWRSWMFYAVTLDQFSSCCGSHTRLGVPFFFFSPSDKPTFWGCGFTLWRIAHYQFKVTVVN